MRTYKKIRISKVKTRDEHHVIMESHLGRTLGPNEVVHHIDGNKLNNSLSNLEVMARSDHSRHHHPNFPKPQWSEEMRATFSKRFGRENHAQSKVTTEIAAAIRKRASEGVRNCEIAMEFGISRPLVSQIKNGLRWA